MKKVTVESPPRWAEKFKGYWSYQNYGLLTMWLAVNTRWEQRQSSVC